MKKNILKDPSKTIFLLWMDEEDLSEEKITLLKELYGEDLKFTSIIPRDLMSYKARLEKHKPVCIVLPDQMSVLTDVFIEHTHVSFLPPPEDRSSGYRLARVGSVILPYHSVLRPEKKEAV